MSAVAMSCGLRRNGFASVIARLVVHSPNDGSRGRSSTGETLSGAPSSRADRVSSRKGYVWIVGNWDWKNGQWEWVNGHWERPKKNHVWRDGYWELQGNTYVWIEGGWTKN